jgi:hypothetical protein
MPCLHKEDKGIEPLLFQCFAYELSANGFGFKPAMFQINPAIVQTPSNDRATSHYPQHDQQQASCYQGDNH